MLKNKLIKSFFLLFLLAIVIFTSIPFTAVSAKSRPKHNSWFEQHEHNKDTKEKLKAKDYLVLVGQSNGTYLAYDNIAFVTDHNKVMVKAKPLADALGLTYWSNTSHWKVKGCTLALDQDKNVYTKNAKTYYFYDYNCNSNKTSKVKCVAEYKQTVYQNYNAVHSASLSTLVNYQYYDTSKITDYLSLGYLGVVVYNKYSTVGSLPVLSNVTNLKGTTTIPNNPTDVNTVINTILKPEIISNGSYGEVKFVEASQYLLQLSNPLLLDLSEVLTTFKSYGLPGDGIYGYGSCDSVITIQGFDINGYSVGEIKTTGSEFLINFPSAVKIKILGDKKNLMLDFTPVKPIVITNTARLSFNQIGWLYPSDGYARQYFVLSEYLRFRTENVSASYTLSRKMLDVTNKDDPDSANSYQRITAVFKGTRDEMTSPYRYLDIQKTKQAINNSLVVFSDTGNAVLAPDYETQLNTMISSITTTGLNTYFPSNNWNRQLVIKLSDNTVNTAYSYILVDPATLDLNYFYDYYLQLHEMVHFYEATRLHYGFRFEAWTEGNATTLAKKTMDKMQKAHTDNLGNDYFDSLYAPNYSFLTPDNKKNFEAYYLSATGWNATVIGYHFTDFLQDTYGDNIIYRILEKVSAANIPTNAGRNSTYDKQFTDCIKAVTSNNVFQLFVEYCVE